MNFKRTTPHLQIINNQTFVKNLLIFFLLLYCFVGLQAQNSSETARLNLLIDSIETTATSLKTFYWSEELIELSEQHDFTEGRVVGLKEKARYFSFMGQYEKEIKVYQELLLSAEAEQNDRIILDVAMDMAAVLGSLKMLEESLAYYEKSKIYALKLKDWRKLILIHNGIGAAYIYIEDWDTALTYLLKAKELVVEKNDTSDLSQLDSNLGMVYAKLGRGDLAVPLIRKRLASELHGKDSFQFASSYTNLALAYASSQDFEKAFMYYDSSLFYARKLNTIEDEFYAYLGISETYTMQDDFSNAFGFYKKYHELKDTFFNHQSRLQVNELEQRFQKNMRETQLLLKEKKIQNLRLGILAFAALFLIVVLLFLRRREKTKRKLQLQKATEELMISKLENKELLNQKLATELKYQQADLTNLALDIARKNQFSNELINQLKNLQKTKPNTWQSQLKNTIIFVSDHLRINEDLEQLQTNIGEINQAFYEKLDAQFSNLSANDKYVLGLIRLNLSNKEIGMIKNISSGSAKTARHRLRKKLGLKPEIDLVGFLKKI